MYQNFTDISHYVFRPPFCYPVSLDKWAINFKATDRSFNILQHHISRKRIRKHFSSEKVNCWHWNDINWKVYFGDEIKAEFDPNSIFRNDLGNFNNQFILDAKVMTTTFTFKLLLINQKVYLSYCFPGILIFGSIFWRIIAKWIVDMTYFRFNSLKKQQNMCFRINDLFA